MLQKNLIAILLTLASHASFSQFNWGVRTGFQYSTLHFNKTDDWNSWKPSYMIPGFFAQYNFNERTALSADILFANKGFKWEGYVLNPRYGDERVGYTYYLPYFNVPVMFQYNLTSQFSVFAGGEFGVKLYSSVVIDGERIQDKDLFTNRIDLGVSGGLAVTFLPGYSLRIRYSHGLSNVLGKDVEVWSDGRYVNAKSLGYKFKNQAVQLSLSSALSISETEKKTSVSFGIRQGISSYDLYGAGVNWRRENGAHLINRVGYEAGLDVRFNIQKYFFASTGLSYLQPGGQVEGDEAVKVNYLVLPLIVGISPVKTDIITFSIEGGLGIHKELSSVNPYESLNAGNNDGKHPYASSLIYGFEIATDAVDRLTLFLSYRKFSDTRFYELDNLEFMSKGHSLSLGVRLGKKNKSRVQPAKDTYQVDPEHYEIDSKTYNTSSSFSFGLKGGLNVNNTAYRNIPDGYTDDSQGQLGFHSGLFFRIKLTDRIALTPELQYIQKGYNYDDHGAEKKLRLKYIESPIILSYSANKYVDIEAGSVVGIFIESSLIGSDFFDRDEYYHETLEYGLIGGLRFNVSPRFSIGCRYYHGLKNISNLFMDENRISGETTEEFNRSFQVSTYFKLTSKH